MRKTITDRDCLRAAERALSAHLLLRPATATELAAQASALRIHAAALRAAAVALPHAPSISSVIECGERGAHVVSLNHALGRAENQRVKDCMRMEADAARADARADSLDEAAQRGDGVQYRLTLDAITARVDYYRALVG